ncbi:MAG: hypothetical protein IKY61_01795, partial [Thermoguttaceae bacterium]|nr:hypothetical protein [Thermoguttaceae bacterium]
MKRSTSLDDGDSFIRDCFGGDASASPSPERSATSASRFEERRRWATTTLAIFGTAAIAGAVFAVAGACWSTWPLFVRAAFLVGAIVVAHCGGTFAERR